MSTEKKKKRGRPVGYRVEKPMNQPLPKVMVTPDQLEIYKAAAEAKEQTFSAWVRETLDKAAKRVLKS